MDSKENCDQWEFMKEVCILVDDKDNQIGCDTKKNCHLRSSEDGSTMCHRAFSVFLFNSQGQLLIQRRSSDKITFPLFWANTCCSHPLNVSGETETDGDLGVKRAAIRKLNHELGIPMDTFLVSDFYNVLTVKYSAPSNETWGENEIDHVLFVKKDVSMQLNKQEVSDIQYCTYEEVMDHIEHTNGHTDDISPWFEKICRHYLKELFAMTQGLELYEKSEIISF